MKHSVTEVSGERLSRNETPATWKAKLLAEGKVVSVETEGVPVGLDELERFSAGWGTAVSEALDWTRGEW